jgi:carbonic anhydrase
LPPHKFLAQLNERPDEIGVRNALAAGRFSSTLAPVAKEWLKQREDSRAAESSNKRDSREEETLSIARRALSIAEDANAIATRDLAAAVSQARWAKWAAIVATVAATIATKDQILALIFLP